MKMVKRPWQDVFCVKHISLVPPENTEIGMPGGYNCNFSRIAYNYSIARAIGTNSL